MKLLFKLLLFLFVAVPVIVTVTGESKVFAAAQEDVLDEEEEAVEDEEEAVVEEGGGSEGGGAVEQTGEAEEESKEELVSQGSKDADVTILFTTPSKNGQEMSAGKIVEFLIGFANNGDKDFILDTVDASFRYPMDFNFYIQNFTTASYHRAVKPRQEATLMYSFFPAEAFAGRPLGLQVNLAYHDADGIDFTEAVFNQTVNIIEVDDGLDGETFFLYLFLIAFVVLLLLAGHHFLSAVGQKKGPKKPVVETGTVNRNDVDYDWLPKETLKEIKKQNLEKSPKMQTRQSPRQRKLRDNR